MRPTLRQRISDWWWTKARCFFRGHNWYHVWRDDRGRHRSCVTCGREETQVT